jgi:tetratricopeptide (TPR) repeat protein
MPIRTFTAIAFTAALALAAPILHADALLKPIPSPDLSRLPAQRATELNKARIEFEKAKASLVGDSLAEAYALMGAAYAREELYDAAAVALEDAAQAAPKDGRWVYAQGLVARAQKQNAVAQNYFDLAFGLNQDYLPIRVMIARSKFDNGDLEGAHKLMSDYVAQHNDQAAPYAILADIALRQKRYPEAIEHARRALALDPKANRLYATLADAQAAAGDAKAAADARAKAGSVAPQLDDPLGQGLLGQVSSSTTAVAPAAAAPPDDVILAAQALAKGNYKVARPHLDKALAQRPNDPALLALYARVEAADGNLAAAKSRANAAVAADPGNALAHVSAGVALEMSGDDAGAQRAYEQAIHANAKLPEPRMLLGALLMRTGRNDDAVAQYRALVQLDHGVVNAWMHLIAADVVAGRCGAALRDVSDVLAKDASNTSLLEMFVRLASTCPEATAEEKRGALEYGGKLYHDFAIAPIAEAYAMALAANGKWDDAIKTQQAAMFVLVRNNMTQNLPGYREFLTLFQSHKVPNRPWPASASVFHPKRLAPDPQQPAAPAPAAPPKK